LAKAKFAAAASAAQLPVRQIDAVLPGGSQHDAQVVVADLVAEAAGPAVDHHRDLAGEEPERLRGRLVEDLLDELHLHEVIAGPERPELRLAALDRPPRHLVRVGARQHPALLDVLQVRTVPEAVGHGPGGALFQHATQVARGERQVPAMGSDAGRHVLEQLRHDVAEAGPDVGAAQT